jgi:hypothetical protein
MFDDFMQWLLRGLTDTPTKKKKNEVEVVRPQYNSLSPGDFRGPQYFSGRVIPDFLKMRTSPFFEAGNLVGTLYQAEEIIVTEVPPTFYYDPRWEAARPDWWQVLAYRDHHVPQYWQYFVRREYIGDLVNRRAINLDALEVG